MVGLQVYPLSTDIRKEFMYVVSVQSLPEGQFALQLHKVWYKWKFPDHIMSQEQLPASDLELKLVKASRDVIRLIEGKLDTEIRDMQLLFMQDFHGNSVKLAGTQQTYLREAPPTKEKLFKLIPQSSMRKTRSYSTALRLHSRVESPLRPISTIIRPKLRAKPRKLPVIGKPSPLTRQLVVKPPRKLPEVGDNTPPEPEKHRSLMVDQEAQAQTWETVDSTEASHLRLNPSSMFPNWSYYKGPGSHLQTVNSTISLPEPDSLPRSSVIRLGDLKNPNRVRGRAQSTLRSSPV